MRSALLWSCLVVYALARVLQVHEMGVPRLAIVALHVLPPMVFALVHGAGRFGARGILAFMAIGTITGNCFENFGVLTGFPFGRYYFTDAMGPKVFAVPVLLGLAYLGMGYLSWTLAEVLVGGRRTIAVPLAATFVMVAWDFSMDPVWSTVLRCWVWLRGGPWFGVPTSNYAGWFLTNYVFFQAFALYDRRHKPAVSTPGHYGMAVLFYAASALGNLFFLIPHGAPAIVTDPAGAQWKTTGIFAVCALCSVLTMGGFALMSGINVLARPITQTAKNTG